jgi:carbon-monoxide dehydrogenase iron sulfur subunit
MKRIYSKNEVCIACHLCEVYCQAGHAKSKDLIKAMQRESGVPRTRVEEKKPISFSLQCRHCDEPACVYACLTGALTKDPITGVVNVETDKCMGCWTCILVCPHGGIRQDKSKGTIAKCDLCAGKEAPLCVTNCPNEALVYVESE